MNAIILSIGDELVLGQTVDTNSAWLSRRLAEVGCPVLLHLTVADEQLEIERAIRDAAARCDVLLVSGGLGPTADDLTREALAHVLGMPLEMNDAWVRRLEEFFKHRGRPMPERNKVQAMVPHGARMIENSCGTAPGLAATIGACQVFVMPGVPVEMMSMFEADELPWIRQHGGGAVILSRTLHSFGVGESTVGELLGDLMNRTRNPSVGTTVSSGMVSLRLNSRFPTRARALEELNRTEAACRAVLGNVIFGADEDLLPQVVAKLLRGHPVAGHYAPAVCTAESCTGGLLAKYLTDVPGSSSFFRQGWVTYTNEAKMNQLGVTPETLRTHGAVSEPTVREMAEGAALRSAAPYALAVSGVAGPDGGTPGKPVGTVCIALSSPRGECEPTAIAAGDLDIVARTFHFSGDREAIRDRAAKMALTMLRYRLLGESMPF